MKNGAKIGMILLLAAAIALTVFGAMGLSYERQERAAQKTPYEEYLEKVRTFDAEAKCYQLAGETSVANMDAYIAQMEKDQAAFQAAGGDPALVDSFLTEARAQRAEAAEKHLKTITDKCADIQSYEGRSEEDTEAIEQANNQLPKVSNQVKAALKKMTKITDTESKQSCETVVSKQFDKARAAIKDACEKNGLTLALDEFAVETKSVDALNAELAKVEEAEQLLKAEEAEEIRRIEELGKGFKGYLKRNWDYFFWLAGLALVIAGLCFLGWFKPELLKQIGKKANKSMMLIALVVITLFFFVTTRYSNLTPANVYNVINQYSYIIILATGMLLCIVSSANIDLSVGRVMGFIGAVAAKLIIDGGMPVWFSMLVCLLLGILIGAWQGFWIAYVKIPAFVVTLAGQLTFYGLTMVLLKGETKAPFPDSFNNVFGAALPDYLGDLFKLNLGLNITTMLIGIIVVLIFLFVQIKNRAQRVSKGYSVEPLGSMLVKCVAISAVLLWLFYSLAKYKGMPTVLITVSLVLLIYTFITSKMVIGRHLYAMGGNVNAARLSGVKTQRMLFLTYVNMGFLAALAGLAFTVRANSSFPSAGQGEELNAIAACYIGGASAYGGVGTVGGALVGALTMGMIKNGMSIMGMQQSVQQVVLGLVLLAAVVIDIVSKSNGTSLSFLSRFGGKGKKAVQAPAQKT